MVDLFCFSWSAILMPVYIDHAIYFTQYNPLFSITIFQLWKVATDLITSLRFDPNILLLQMLFKPYEL